MIRIGKVIAVLLALFMCCEMRNARDVVLAESDPAYIMRQIVDTYRSLLTYADKGRSIVRLSSVNYTVEFETVFKRPARLRFNWTVQSSAIPAHKQHALIWSDGTKAWALYSFRGNKLEQKDDLGLAVAGATGASWRTAHDIPRLLTDDIRGFRLDEMRDLKMVGNHTIDNVDCVVLAGGYGYQSERAGHYAINECKIWVGREDHLIRRIERRSEKSVQEEIRTQIVINKDIPDSKFTERGS